MALQRIARVEIEERDVTSTGREYGRGGGVDHFAGNPLKLQCLMRRDGSIIPSTGISEVKATLLADTFTGAAYAEVTTATYNTITQEQWTAGTHQSCELTFPAEDMELAISEGRLFEDFVIVFSFGDYTFGWVALRIYRDGVPEGELPAEPGALGIYTGEGEPEGVVTAAVGSIYNQIDGGVFIAEWIKCSGAGNTGWQ